MEERKSLIQWIKEHKKELIITGVSITALILIVLGIKNRTTIIATWEALKEIAEKTAKKNTKKTTIDVVKNPLEQPLEISSIIPSNSPNLSVEVSRHIRNLPEGWHASPEKIAAALANNITLLDGQTWVDSYTKGGFAA